MFPRGADVEGLGIACKIEAALPAPPRPDLNGFLA